MKSFKKLLVLLLAILLGCPMFGMTTFATESENVNKIVLFSTQSGENYTNTATLNGETVPEYDYTWHADPSVEHTDVKNSPAEYYTGTKPTGEDAVYIAHDIVYYPELDENKFQKVNYDGEQEWVYMYEAEGYEKYIFSTLPVQKNGFPTEMMHSEEEAYQNAVLHITKPGTYELVGDWHGQILIDLGDEDDVYADPTQKVTLILNGVDITCTVAPGVIFKSVYECDNAWENAESYSHIVDTKDAGANVILADGSVNNVIGTNIFRILKTKFKDDTSTDAHPAQKKSYKIDGTFYSYQSMNITGGSIGSGVLNITAGFEGLDTEHHLTLNGGNVNIYSQDDGINVNEDGVSVLTVNGGSLHICAGLGSEGDGIDSNGFLVVNGGTVIAAANPASDSGLDSDCGSYVFGGTVVALGSTMDWAEADNNSTSTQPVLNMRFGGSQSADEAIIITNTEGIVVFAYDPDKDEVTGTNTRTYSGAIISAPGLAIGESYNIYIGGDVNGTDISGVYDVSTVTGFSGSTMQCYNGNIVGGFQGGGNKGDRPNEERPEGEIPAMPNGGMQGDMTPPDGQQGGMVEPPTGDFILQQGQRPDGFGQQNTMGATCTYETAFTLSEQVNAFSSVSDYMHLLTKVEAKEAEYGQNGSKEHYVCSSCSKLFADENAATELAQEDITIPAKSHTVLIIALFFVGFAILAVGVIVIVIFCKKNKK